MRRVYAKSNQKRTKCLPPPTTEEHSAAKNGKSQVHSGVRFAINTPLISDNNGHGTQDQIGICLHDLRRKGDREPAVENRIWRGKIPPGFYFRRQSYKPQTRSGLEKGGVKFLRRKL